jgi:hypothetical protein
MSCIELDQLLEPDPPENLIVVNNNGSLSFFENGVKEIAENQVEVEVNFAGRKINDSYTFNELSVQNTTDSMPLSLEATVIEQTVGGFKVLLSGAPDSGNYRLHWEVNVTGV